MRIAPRKVEPMFAAMNRKSTSRLTSSALWIKEDMRSPKLFSLQFLLVRNLQDSDFLSGNVCMWRRETTKTREFLITVPATNEDFIKEAKFTLPLLTTTGKYLLT